jgi:hypothetical protein
MHAAAAPTGSAFVSYLEWAKLIATSLSHLHRHYSHRCCALVAVSKVRSASSIGFFALDQVLGRRWHRLPIMSIKGAFDIFVLVVGILQPIAVLIALLFFL